MSKGDQFDFLRFIWGDAAAPKPRAPQTPARASDEAAEAPIEPKASEPNAKSVQLKRKRSRAAPRSPPPPDMPAMHAASREHDSFVSPPPKRYAPHRPERSYSTLLAAVTPLGNSSAAR